MWRGGGAQKVVCGEGGPAARGKHMVNVIHITSTINLIPKLAKFVTY